MSQVSNQGSKSGYKSSKPYSRGLGRSNPKGSTTKPTNKWSNNNNKDSSNNKYGVQISNQKFQNKSLYISNIFNKFGNNNLKQKLFEQEIDQFKAILQKLGNVEDIKFDAERNSMVVTFDSSETARKVLRTLLSEEEREKLMRSLESTISSKQVCPNLHNYKYNWSRVRQNIPRNTYVLSVLNQQRHQKSLIFEKDNDSGSSESKEPINKHEKKTQQKIENNINSNSSNEEFINKQIKQIPMNSDHLRREADRLKLDEEIKYLNQQKVHITSEINHEKERFLVRTTRITKFSEELEKVKIETAKLEKQIKEEQKWKDVSDLSIQKLEEELSYITNQLQILQTSPQQK